MIREVNFKITLLLYVLPRSLADCQQHLGPLLKKNSVLAEYTERIEVNDKYTSAVS